MKVVYIGQCCIDKYVQSGIDIPGGGALNFAIHFSNLLQKEDTVAIVSAIGNDKQEELVTNTLNKHKVNCQFVHKLTGSTSTIGIINNLEGEKTFQNYEPGVLANYSLVEEDKLFIKQSDVIITQAFSQIEHIFNQVAELRVHGYKVADFMDLSDFNKDLNLAKHYFDKFSLLVFGLDSVKDLKLIEQIKSYAKLKSKDVLITLGNQGSLFVSKGNEYRLGAINAKVVDTTGCGDAYLATFIYNLFNKKSVKQSMLAASRKAAEVASSVGAYKS